MSKLAGTLLILGCSISGTALASVASDCAYLEGRSAPAGMCSRISEVAANLNQFQPPQPCANKEQVTFSVGAPAEVCSGNEGGGSSGSGSSGQGSFQ